MIHTVKHAQVPQAHAQQDSIFAAQPKSNKISTLRLDNNKANSVYGKQGASQSNSMFWYSSQCPSPPTTEKLKILTLIDLGKNEFLSAVMLEFNGPGTFT